MHKRQHPRKVLVQSAILVGLSAGLIPILPSTLGYNVEVIRTRSANNNAVAQRSAFLTGNWTSVISDTLPYCCRGFTYGWDVYWYVPFTLKALLKQRINRFLAAAAAAAAWQKPVPNMLLQCKLNCAACVCVPLVRHVHT